MQEHRTINGPDGEFGLRVHRPDADAPHPVVLFFHHGPGLDDDSKDAMRILADAGYYVAAPDRSYRHAPWLTYDVGSLVAQGMDSPAFQEFVQVLLSTSDDMVDTDLVAVLDHLSGDPAARTAPLGCIGYCIGARTVLVAMTRHPSVFGAGVALHPSFCVTDQDDSPHLAVPTIRGSLYIGIGAEDDISSAQQNEPLVNAAAALGQRAKVEIHPGAGHGFAVPGHAWHETAASRSYAAAFGLFESLR